MRESVNGGYRDPNFSNSSSSFSIVALPDPKKSVFTIVSGQWMNLGYRIGSHPS